MSGVVVQAVKIIREITHSWSGNVAPMLEPIIGTLFLHFQTNYDIRFLLTECKRLLQ